MLESLSSLNSKGLIAAPDDTHFSFFKRVQTLLNLGEDLSNGKSLVGEEVFLYKKIHVGNHDLEINWVLRFKNNSRALCWEPASTHIFDNESTKIPVLKISREKSEYIAHEAVHAARCAFNEPKFEEVLAYSTSKSKIRRFFGPLFRSSKEALLFVFISLSMFSLVMLDCYYWLAISAQAVYLSWLLIRLFLVQRTFAKALNHINRMFEVSSPLMVALRLSDEEIKLFSRNCQKQSIKYINSRECFRWKQILNSYCLIKDPVCRLN